MQQHTPSQMAWPSCGSLRQRLQLGRLEAASRLTVTCLLVLAIVTSATSVQVPFRNCQDASTLKSDPPLLQFNPLQAFATYKSVNNKHLLTLTVYGNVSGSSNPGTSLPPPSSGDWKNPNITTGKIIDYDYQLSPNATTLNTRGDVLNYNVWTNQSRLCLDLINDGECPLAPVFLPPPPPEVVADRFPAFTTNHTLDGSYGFTSIVTYLRINSGFDGGRQLACIVVEVVPYLGDTVSAVLRYIPLTVLLIVGFATVFAAIFNPWSTVDIFLWSSNSSGGEEVLRLVTPGFADCLQYIQFVVLTGALSLNYPGFYQPVVSRFSWSTLMFNQSLVSHQPGRKSLADGLYTTHASPGRMPYGLEKLSELVGMARPFDIWAGAMVWLVVIIGIVIVLANIDFAVRWVVRKLNGTRSGDLRKKHWPFTVGNVFRIVMIYFLLPVSTFSLFQLLEAGLSPPYVSGLAAAILILLIGMATFISYLVINTKPADPLFDDLTKVLCYGPFYNTYTRKTTGFAVVPLLLTFMRAIAIGAVQRSAIAQLIILAICEVVLICTLAGVRPYPRVTSMNIYHSGLAVVRLITLLMSLAFVPEVTLSDATRGWLGYVILMIHAIVLFIAFFLNALQTIVEILARMAGAGQENGTAQGGGLAGVLGMKQLSRRMSRKHPADLSVHHHSVSLSHSDDRKSQVSALRPRSTSGSSAILLNVASSERTSLRRESAHHRSASASTFAPTTPGGRSTLSYVAAGSAAPGVVAGVHGRSGQPSPDPYYRRPRNRALSGDLLHTTDNRRSPWTSGDWTRPGGSSATSNRGSVHDTDSQPPVEMENNYVDNWVDPRSTGKDYASREMDQFYRSRGAQLSSQPSRRLGTGPANPTSPVDSATGWFRNLFGGKTKQKGKGFEVIRTGRVPPARQPISAVRDIPSEVDMDSEYDDIESRAETGMATPLHPELAIELLPHGGSQRSLQGATNQPTPGVPRKSSKRKTQNLLMHPDEASRLDVIEQTPPTSPQPYVPGQLYDPNPTTPASSRMPFFSEYGNNKAKRISAGAESVASMSNRTYDPSSGGTDGANDGTGRPTNVGYVPRQRMGDNIYMVNEDLERHGSAAELMGSDNRGHERGVSDDSTHR